ncbi:Flp family type IVb pilin [Altererythrobacter sp. MTPC7]|uniref:Flp family type IVb pilin n=1 Tax=Altererythrobacter sp. MTPC7 TaxID=3056567 RepID=UPI0036F321E6
MRAYIKALLADIRGATAIEYGLILALVFLAMVGAAAGVGTETGLMWDRVSDEVVDARERGTKAD